MAGEYIGMAIQVSYYAAAFLFIIGLKRMSSPLTAASGIKWAGVGMLVATAITYANPATQDGLLIPQCLADHHRNFHRWRGGLVDRQKSGHDRHAADDRPCTTAWGGGSAAAISAVELLGSAEHASVFMILAVLGGFIGSVSFSG